MSIVRHDQAVSSPENAVIGDFEHPVPAVQEGHGLQVAAQGNPVLVFDTIGAVGYPTLRYCHQNWTRKC